jgi:hypothetical protein
MPSCRRSRVPAAGFVSSLCRRAFRALRREFLGEGCDEDYGTITIPQDATAKALVAKAKKTFKEESIPFTVFSSNLLDLIRKDLELVRGKTFRVLTYYLSHNGIIRSACRRQQPAGADGNAAALLEWLTEEKPRGCYISVANDDSRLFRGSNGSQYTAVFYGDENFSKFRLIGIWSRYGGSPIGVAFREV